MKIVSIVGARPQFVKVAPVSECLRAMPGVTEVLVHTGQHYDLNMSEAFFRELTIPDPDYNLGIVEASHAAQTGRMLIEIAKVLEAEKPDRVVVFGDTNSTLAGALAAAKLCIPIVHVEAGLRSFNRSMPEEVNRVLTDQISSLLLAPTAVARSNLLAEGILEERIRVTGDVMYDVFLRFREGDPTIFEDDGLPSGRYVLATIHRAENTDDPVCLGNIVQALAGVSHEIPIIFPIHPRTRKAMIRDGIDLRGDNLFLLEPQPYLRMLALESRACLIVTDSGGVQKEAYFQRIPCVTLRQETEWVELVDSGWNRLVPRLTREEIEIAIWEAIGRPGMDIELYGEGSAADLVATEIARLPGDVSA